MRSVFSLFDPDGTGTINASDLRRLHDKLGEPISEEEARDAVAMLAHGADRVSFADFLAFWDGTHISTRPTAAALGTPVHSASISEVLTGWPITATASAGAAGASAPAGMLAAGSSGSSGPSSPTGRGVSFAVGTAGGAGAPSAGSGHGKGQPAASPALVPHGSPPAGRPGVDMSVIAVPVLPLDDEAGTGPVSPPAPAAPARLPPPVDAALRERKRQHYQARFKFLRAKLPLAAKKGAVYTEASTVLSCSSNRRHSHSQGHSPCIHCHEAELCCQWHEAELRCKLATRLTLQTQHICMGSLPFDRATPPAAADA